MPIGKNLSLGILVCLVVFTIPVVQGEPQYWIATFGVSWPSRIIYVRVPSEPGPAHDLVVKAITVWDQAQAWFKATYFPDGDIYTFVLGNQRPVVFSEFTDYWTVSNYCSSVPLGVEGCTHIDWDDSNNITHAIIFLDTGLLTNPGPNQDPLFLVLHEFGHALGLSDYPWSSSCPFQDLLCLYYPDEYPSTLDLYAIHQLAEGKREANVFLPSNIPYTYYNHVPGTTTSGTTKELQTIQPSARYVLTANSKSSTLKVMPPIQSIGSQRLSRSTFAVFVVIVAVVLLAMSFKKRPDA